MTPERETNQNLAAIARRYVPIPLEKALREQDPRYSLFVSKSKIEIRDSKIYLLVPFEPSGVMLEYLVENNRAYPCDIEGKFLPSIISEEQYERMAGGDRDRYQIKEGEAMRSGDEIGQQDPNGIIVSARALTIASWLLPHCVGETDEHQSVQALTKADALILANNKYPFDTLVIDKT